MDSKGSTPATKDENLQQANLRFQEHNNHTVPRFCNHFDLFPVIGFVFLTYNVAISIFRSRGKPWDLAFAISCYVELILLFWCLKLRENLGADAPVEHIKWLKIVVFVLTTLLAVSFAYRVSLIMPMCLKIVIWGMGGSVIVAGFYAFFIFDEDVKGANGYCKLDNTEENEDKFHDQLSPEEKV